MLKNYLTVALRNLGRHKVFSIINITGLAVGMTVFMLVARYIHFELSFDRFHEKLDRIARVEQIIDHNGPKEKLASCPEPLSGVLAEDFPDFEAVSRVISSGTVTLRLEGSPHFRQEAFFADSPFFRIFSFPWVAGDARTALDSPFSMVLTERAARRIFGDADPLGRVVRLGDDNDYQVTGVMGDVPENSHLRFDLLISSVSLSAAAGRDSFSSWSNNWVPLYALLEEGRSVAEVSEKIRYGLKKYQGEENQSQLYLRPLARIHLHADAKMEFARVGSIKNVYIFGAVALFVLLIAGINFMNLSTARAADRAREVGLRKVCGAPRTSLLRQFMGESVFTALLAMLGAAGLMTLLLPEFNHIVNRNLSLSLVGDGMFYLLLLGIALVVGGLAGIYPAVVLSAFRPISVLRGRFSSGARGSGMRRALVVFQFFISVVLISGTLVILQQVDYLLHKDLGYNTEQVLVFPSGSLERGRYRPFRERLLRNPKIVAVASSDYMIHSSTNWTRITWEGAGEGEWIKINVNYVDEDFMAAYGMEMAAGRSFSPEFGADRGKVVILNQAAARRIGWEEPVGRNIIYYGDYKLGKLGPVEVVGVARDFHFLSLHNPVTPMMLRPEPEGVSGWNVSVKILGTEVPETIAFIGEEFGRAFPEASFDYRFLDQDFERMYQEERKSGRVVFYLAGLAVFIAGLGLFGLASYATRKRTREIGIRKLLGASASGIAWLLNTDFLKLTLLGCALAWPAAYFIMSRWLQNFLYRVPLRLWVFGAAGATAVLVALITVSFQSIRAASADPTQSLRSD